jgi:hypothetical protein
VSSLHTEPGKCMYVPSTVPKNARERDVELQISLKTMLSSRWAQMVVAVSVALVSVVGASLQIRKTKKRNHLFWNSLIFIDVH